MNKDIIINKITTPTGRIYEVGRNRYPSITTVLSAGEDKSFLVEWRKRVGDVEADRITKESTDIGTHMHLCFEHFLKGIELPPHNTPEEAKGYKMFRAGSSFIRDFVKEVIGQECIVWSDILKVAGQFDLLCKNRKGEIVLVDFKSTKFKKTKAQADDYRLQCAFYRQCIKETMDLDIHHSSLFFVTRACEPYWMRFENSETTFKELVDARLKFCELKGF